MKIGIKQTHNSRSRYDSKGFTLIELMVSMSITIVILGLLMGMTKIAVGSWKDTHSRTRASRLAQEVFSTVGKDLEGIVVRSGNNYEWVLVKDSGNNSSENGPDGSTEIGNPLVVSFFSAVTDRYNGQINTTDDLGGDISLVRYKLIYQDLIGGATQKPVYALYRERIDPNFTFDAALAKQSIDPDVAVNNEKLEEADLKRDYSLDEIVSEQNYLAENIYDFTLSFNFEYSLADGKSGYKRVVIQTNGASKSLSIRGNQILVDGAALTLPSDAGAPRLAGADVSILVLSDEGMNGIKTKNINNKSDLAKYLKKHGRHYSKSVILPQS